MPQYSLGDAIAGALATDKSERVSKWRDAIAEHGAAGIDAVMEWAGDAVMGSFAVTVIEAAGKTWSRKSEAVRALTFPGMVGATAFVRRFAGPGSGLPPARPPTTAKRMEEVIPARAGLDSPGFNRLTSALTGPTWRSRYNPISMIPLLLRPLRELDFGFSTYPIYALPEIQIADRDRYEQGAEKEQGWRASKLVIYAHGEDANVEAHIALGYWVERGTGTTNTGQLIQGAQGLASCCPEFISEKTRVEIPATDCGHGAARSVYRRLHRRPIGEPGDDLGFRGSDRGGRSRASATGSGSELGRGWLNFVERLAGLPDDRWYGFHIWKEWPAAEAIADGHPFAVEKMLPVLLDLASIYLEIIGPTNVPS